MPRSSLIACAIALSVAAAAQAAPSLPGVNLRWDHCYGDGGVSNKTFACDTNSGLDQLVGSVELASGMSDVPGVEFYIDIGSASPTLPAWWQFKTAGTCRQGSMLFVATPPAASTCVDWGGGFEAGAIGGYAPGFSGANSRFLTGAVAVPSDRLAAFDPGVEYFVFAISINHQKTVGAGTCAGCDIPVCIFLSTVRLETPNITDDLYITQGANDPGSQFVAWQNGVPTDVHQGCALTSLCNTKYTGFTCVPYSATPARSSTWGAVKALYR